MAARRRSGLLQMAGLLLLLALAGPVSGRLLGSASRAPGKWASKTRNKASAAFARSLDGDGDGEVSASRLLRRSAGSASGLSCGSLSGLCVLKTNRFS
jgi:hypothetical protein